MVLILLIFAILNLGGSIMYTFIEYPKCSTCKNAKKYLIDHNIPFKERNINTQTPNPKELAALWALSNLPLKRFFNTSGMVYKELGLSQKLSTLSTDAQLQLLSSNGMLIKRPILFDDHCVIVGFKIADYEKLT